MKIAVLDHNPHLLQFLSSPLIQVGYQTLTELPPINWEDMMHFGPQVLVLGLRRRLEARNRPIVDVSIDVDGYEALVEMEKYPTINVVPILIVGIELDEADIPTTLAYDLFLRFPDDMDLYVRKVAELGEKVKSRHRISGYICPNPGCSSRLTYMREPIKDLFCPKCGSSVALIDNEECIWLNPDGVSQRCQTQSLLAKRART